MSEPLLAAPGHRGLSRSPLLLPGGEPEEASLPVDVVVPAWGRYVRTLPAALESAAGAGGVIAVVDEACAKEALRAGATSVVLRPEGGLGSARNAGLAVAQRPYVLFLDADDVLLPGALSALHEALVADPSAVLSFGRLRYRDGTGEWPSVADAVRMTTDGALAHLVERNSLPSVASLIRRSAAPPDLFPDVIHEDWVAAARLRAAGGVVFVDTFTVLYSTYEGSRSRSPVDPREELRCRALVREAAGFAP